MGQMTGNQTSTRASAQRQAKDLDRAQPVPIVAGQRVGHAAGGAPVMRRHGRAWAAAGKGEDVAQQFIGGLVSGPIAVRTRRREGAGWRTLHDTAHRFALAAADPAILFQPVNAPECGTSDEIPVHEGQGPHVSTPPEARGDVGPSSSALAGPCGRASSHCNAAATADCCAAQARYRPPAYPRAACRQR